MQRKITIKVQESSHCCYTPVGVENKRFLEKREPKLSENIKSAMLIKGGNANSTVTQVLRDVVRIFIYIHTF